MPDQREGSRILNACPYNDCGSAHLAKSTDGTLPRRPDQILMQCTFCQGYCVRLQTGLVFPLVDASDPDADAAVTTRSV